MALFHLLNELSFSWFPVIINTSLTGSLLLTVALTANHLIKRNSAGVRFLLIFTALSSLLFLPVLTSLIQLGASSLSLNFKTEPQMLTNIQSQNTPAQIFFEPQILIKSGSIHQNTSLTYIALLFIIWFMGVLLMGIKICRGLFGMNRLLRSAENKKTIFLKTFSIKVATHPKIKIPVTCGLLYPLIILPEDYPNWPEEQKQAILCHEAAHIKRRDNLTNIISQFITAIYWFNPLVWCAQNELRINREKACDDYVLHTDIKPSSYAGILLSAIRTGNSSYFRKQESIVLNFNSKGEKRMKYILDSTINHEIPSNKAKIYTLLLVALLSIPLASFQILAAKNNDMPTDSEYWKDINFTFNGTNVEITLLDPNGQKTTLSGSTSEFPFGWPEKGVRDKINSLYGTRFHPILKQIKFHSGVDIDSHFGTPIIATADGQVEKTDFWQNSYGKYVVIKHKGFSTLYSQLNEIKVKTGDTVQKGDLVGYSGRSGVATGPHLHYEIRYDSKPLNPELFLSKVSE